jgi:hypothetical protein
LSINLDQGKLFGVNNDAVSAYFLKHEGRIVENQQLLDDIPHGSRFFFSMEIALKFVPVDASHEFLAQIGIYRC